MRLQLLLIFFAACFAVGAQSQTFQKTYGTGSGYGRGVQQTADNLFIVTGSVNGIGAGGSDAYLLRLDAAGDTLWTRTYGGSNLEETFSVNQTSDNGFILAGHTNSFGVGGDAWLVRTDANGDTLWTRTYGGSGEEMAWSVDRTTDGGYIACGQTNSFGSGSRDVFAIRIEANGDTLWTKAYGGAGEDVAYSVQQTNDGGFIFCGHTRSFTLGATGIYVIKTDADGDTTWTRSINGGVYNNGQTIEQTGDNGYIISAYSNAGLGGSGDMCLIKMDVNGTVEWSKAFGKIGDDYPFNAEQADDGGYFICGSLNMNVSGPAHAYLVRTDADGDTLWTRTFDAIQTTNAGWGTATADGGFIIATHLASDGNLLVIKVDADGNTNCDPEFTTVTASIPLLAAIGTATVTNLAGTAITAAPTPSLVYAGGAIADLCSLVGLEEARNIEPFPVFPNPASDKLSCQLAEDRYKLELLNAFGQCVFAQQISDAKATLDVSNFAEGIYFIRATTDNQEVYSRKIIIAR